jgi:hypothetical protein
VTRAGFTAKHAASQAGSEYWAVHPGICQALEYMIDEQEDHSGLQK